MMKKAELRLTGSGGQGVILATVILAEAGFLDGKFVVQSQSYGPEARGGMCKAEVVIDEKPITYTKVQVPNFLLALTQASLDKYSSVLTKDAVIVADASLEVPASLKAAHTVYQVPILDTAKIKVGRAMTANIVAVGAINAILHLASRESLEKAVTMHIPKGTEELNMKALSEGIGLIEKLNVPLAS